MLIPFGENRWALLHFFFLFMLLTLAVAFSDSKHDLRIRLQNDVFDYFNKLHPRMAADNVVIIDIDERSLDIIGQWPWPRIVLADLVTNLTKLNAKSIVIDGVFAEPDRSSPKYFLDSMTLDDKTKSFFDDELKRRTDDYSGDEVNIFDHDAMFASAIKKSEIFVTGFTYGRLNRDKNMPVNKNRIVARKEVRDEFLKNATHFDAAAINLPMFSNSAAGEGAFMAVHDKDGVLRRAGMIFSTGENLYPSLSLEAMRVALLGRKGTVTIGFVPLSDRKDIDTAYRLNIGEKKIPIESDALLHIYYRRYCNAQDIEKNRNKCSRLDYISAYKFLDTHYTEEVRPLVSGKIVLIGSSAEGLRDLRTTALEPSRPGVELHANIIEQVMQGKYLLRPEVIKGVEAAFIFITGLFFIIFAPFIGVLVSTFLCLTIVIMAIFTAYTMYVDQGILIDPIFPSLAILTIFIVSTILSYARAEARRKMIRHAFGMYVAKDVMRSLERNPEKLKLGGETRELTVMFTDIRKFSTISEGMKPEELIQMMNEFLTSMTDIVMKESGTVDKYIGDAMMAFWNAPKDIPSHAQLACRAALQMQEALEPINRKVEENARAMGKEPILLRAGIGIATGPCAVGNMGSRQRFAYSALGDAVNLASRLEGLTKFYGVNIIATQETLEKTKDLAALELDLIRVVGKSVPARVYVILGELDIAQSSEFKKWQEDHNKFLYLYRNQKFDLALEQIRLSKVYAGEKMKVFYSLYEKRIAELKNQILPENWDAIFEAQQK